MIMQSAGKGIFSKATDMCTGHSDITDIMLKIALNTTQQNHKTGAQHVVQDKLLQKQSYILWPIGLHLFNPSFEGKTHSGN